MKIGRKEEGRGGNEGNLVSKSDNRYWRRFGDFCHDSISPNIASLITKHLLDTIIPITTDIQTRLDDHLQAISNLNKSQSDLTSKLLTTQEKLNETNEKVM